MNDSKVLRVLDSLLWIDAEVTRRAEAMESVRGTEHGATYELAYTTRLAELKTSVAIQSKAWGVDGGFVVALMNERSETKPRKSTTINA